ncbi:D-2-hydroxyacid dehydrogenase [Helicobacter sp. MIT 14-3879]|uniref:D-2-hydroxyacid dehydrogenase n=1 Tax=Helicobacter sp. MIT 14-3879 TaxID=2040649 RepID=UPI000E1E7903|nr:D-2-hydroxyacid dehydrogenase [Helicobacter sp. MIT 14-3879]RDU65119.1 D-2-hydroxyacid dehydrogenase [Helicobacter sp. MIT 14-3879]
MNIVMLDALTLGESNLKEIEKLGKLTIYQTTSRKDIIKRAKDAEVILINKVILDEKILNALPNLRLICITATGMNNIDLECAKKLNIEVKNVANYSTQAVAQHTFMLVLNIIGRLNYYDEYVKKGKWAKSKIFCHLNSSNELYELQNKTWGIIGFGNIGKEVAKIAKAFGVNIVYYSTSGKNSSKDFKQETNLSSLFKNSDIISIHAPLNEKTRNLVTKKEVNLLKKDAILINVGRGGIVNEKDLAKAIVKKDFYFACDVLEIEPMTKNHPFLNKKLKKKILITPHIAWAYKETRDRLMRGVEENIRSFISKK